MKILRQLWNRWWVVINFTLTIEILYTVLKFNELLLE